MPSIHPPPPPSTHKQEEIDEVDAITSNLTDASGNKEEIDEVDAITSNLTDASGNKVNYDEDDDEYSVNAENLNLSSFGIEKLKIFGENTMNFMAKELEKDSELRANSVDDESSNALVIGSMSSSEPNGPMDDQIEASDNPWAEVEDPSSGSTYYHNLVTGESTWDRPQEMDLAPPSPEKSASPHKSEQAPTKNSQQIQKQQQEEEENDDDEEVELLDGEADEWPIVDQLVGSIGGDYAGKIGMKVTDYAALTGVKLDFSQLEDGGALTHTVEGTHEHTIEEVYLELDKLMLTNFHHINKTFRDIDINQDGTLQPNEFRAALKLHGMTMKDEAFELLWSDFDEDGDGSITYVEFVQRYIDKPDKELAPFHAWSIYPWRMVDAGNFVYYENEITGRTQREMPKPAFEKKIDALSRLTPRDPDEPDNGQYMWREGPEEERRRRRFERQQKKAKEKEDTRRRENPTDLEQVEDVLEDLVHTVEYELTEERLIEEYEAELELRSVWNPITYSYRMKDLPEGGQGQRDGYIHRGKFTRKLVADLPFLEAKITQAGELINWHPHAKKPYKNHGQSLWAKMADANIASTAFRGALKSVGKMGKAIQRRSRQSRDSGGDGFTLADLGAQALADIAKDEEVEKDKLTTALVGFTNSKDDTEETGKSNPTGMGGLLSAMKIKKMIGSPKAAAKEKIEDGKEGEGESATRTGGVTFGVNTKSGDDANPQGDGDADKNGDSTPKKRKLNLGLGNLLKSKPKEKDPNSPPVEKVLAKDKPKEGMLKRMFKKKKTEEEIEEEEKHAKEVVYGEDHEKANKIVEEAKAIRDAKFKPWEHPREAPVDTARLYITLAMHAPQYFEEHTETVTKEDGTKEKKVVIDSYKRMRFEKKLVKEIAAVAGISTHHVTLDELTNRDTREGYYMGKDWMLGNEGEFKSAQAKYIEKQEKLEADREAKRNDGSLASRARSASDAMKRELEKRRNSITFPPLLSPSKKKQGEEKKDETTSLRSLANLSVPESQGGKVFFGEDVQLPAIGKDAEAPSTPKPEPKRRGAAVKGKRELMKQIKARNDAATGWMSSKNTAANQTIKKKKKLLSTAGHLNDVNMEKMLVEIKAKVADLEGVSHFQDDSPPKKDLTTKDKLMELGQGCFPVGETEGAAKKSTLLLKALRGKGSEHFRCVVVVTLTAMDDISAFVAAYRVSKAVEQGSRDVPTNGLISNAVKIKAEASGQKLFFDEWEHYWNFIISPVFFGYSTTHRFNPNKKNHKVILGPPKLKVEHTRLQELERDWDRACADYKREFVRGNVSEKFWTPEQLKAHTAKERAEFRLELHKKHLARVVRKQQLARSPEPWMRPRVKPKPFTLDDVEKWQKKYDKKASRKRKKDRTRKEKLHAENQIAIKKRVWDRKVEMWFLRKLLSYNPNKEKLSQKMSVLEREDSEALEKFVREEMDPVKIEEHNKLLRRKAELKQLEAEEITNIFNELKGVERMVKKRDILIKLSKSKKLKERARKTVGMRPILSHPEFINCFMVSPAKVSGFTSVEEFLTFCTIVAKVGTRYLQAKEAIKEEEAAEELKEEEKVSKRAQLKFLREEQAKKRAEQVEERKNFVSGNINGVFFKEDQKRKRDESGNVWEKFHHKCIIRPENSEHSYCCETRKKKWEYDMQEAHKVEQAWREGWEELHDTEKENKKVEYTALVENRIKAGKMRLTKMQTQTVKVLIDDMVSVVERRAWSEYEVADVLFDVCNRVSQDEARRLDKEHKIFEFHEVHTINDGVHRRKVSKKSCESMYNGLHDSVREDFGGFWAAVKGFHNMTTSSLQKYLFRWKYASDEELIGAVWELEKHENLPEGWHMYGDELGNVWYENDKTHESVWERPKSKHVIYYPEDDEEEEPDEFTLEVDKLATMRAPLGGSMELTDFTSSTTVEAEKERHKRRLSLKPQLPHALDVDGRHERRESNINHTTIADIGKNASMHGNFNFKKVAEGASQGPDDKREGEKGKAGEEEVPTAEAEVEKKPKSFSFLEKAETVHDKLAKARSLVKAEEANEKEPGKGGEAVASGVGSVIGDKVASKITIEMYDMDTFGKGDFLGQVNIPFAKLANPQQDVIEMELRRAEPGSINDAQSVENVTGVLGVTLTALELNDETDKVEKWTLKVLYAKKVAKADMFGKSDPICFVKWGKQEIGKTRCIKNTLNPVWDGTEEDTFALPTAEARAEDEKETDAMKRLMKKTSGLGTALKDRGKLFGKMLKKGMMQVKMFVGAATDANKKIVDEIQCRLDFWDEETTRQEMERRYLAREDMRQKKATEVLLRARERPLRDEQESGHRAFLEIVNMCRSLRSPLLRYKYHRTMTMSSHHEMLVQVQDPSSGNFFVAKMLPCEYDEDCERVIREAELIEDVVHPGIVRIKSVARHLIQHFTIDGSATQRWHLAAFVSDWCPGGKLVDYLRNIDYLNITARQMQMWCQQVAAGLKAIHELGITHRNLNPGNVYLDANGKAKVGGFMCFKTGRNPGCGFSYGRSDVGTPQVIAPEVDDGFEVSTKADIWAFGCCIYYWCTGTLPDLRQMGIDRALKNISLHFGNRVRGALRMCLQVHPEVRSNAEEIWMYLCVVDKMKEKKGRAMGRLRKMLTTNKKIDHGSHSKFGSMVDLAGQNKLKLKLLAMKDAKKAAGGSPAGSPEKA
ncbi:hypothetical protein TL16_g02065 [Triparma laevis f. inornata]|uniref:Calmodulin n=1 Tax=Triparma laevis f. inornata TaxID=1714386 RepID=A0A9W7DVW3_9STRA|nr:hypothetical protein TL16_g02065 [Triparma laevis f. inornata]